MEKYKKKLKIQNWISAATALIMIAVMLAGSSQCIRPSYANEHWAGFWNGMITGIATAAILLSIVGVVQNCLALKNEAKLKKMYVKEHDERTRAIWEKVGGQSYWYVSVGMLVAVVVSGYFSPAVSITCLGCLMYFLLVRITLSLYYKDKM